MSGIYKQKGDGKGGESGCGQVLYSSICLFIQQMSKIKYTPSYLLRNNVFYEIFFLLREALFELLKLLILFLKIEYTDK